MSTRKANFSLIVLAILLPVVMVVAVIWGSYELDPMHALKILFMRMGLYDLQQYKINEAFIVLQLRLPRVIIAALVGAGLAVAGCALQGLFNNPLAEPGILGVSSGGALGAVMAIALGGSISYWTVPAAAFLGSLVSAFAVFAIATSRGRTPLATLLLAGIAVNALLSAAVSLVLSLRLDSVSATQRIIFWLIGGFESVSWSYVHTAVIPILSGVLLLQFMARDLNSISLGEETASSLGVAVQRMKMLILVLVSIVTGVSVAVSGVLSFVGLIVPQLLRLVSGPDHRRLLPISALGGAVFLVLMDLISRTIIRPQEIRIGVLTSLLGGPFFLLLLVLNRRKGRIG